MNNMAILVYEPLLRMAFSDDPSLFKTEEDVQATISNAGDHLPIEEWQTYYAKFYGEPPPLSLKQALEKARVLRVIQHDLWEINFRNFVGQTRLGSLKLHVLNKKISEELYQSLLDELAEKYSSLVFSFASPVGQHFKKDRVGQDSAFVEYLFLRRFLLHGTPDIDAISDILVSSPHRQFEKELLPCSIEECHTADIAIVHALLGSPMAKLPAGNPLQQTYLAQVLKEKTKQSLFPVRAAKQRKYLTLDTLENRFIKFFLRLLQEKIESLQVALSDGMVCYFNPHVGENLDLLRKKIGQFLSHNMWQDVGEMRFVPVNSQILQRKDGYRQLFSLYSLLQLATYCDFLAIDFTELVGTQDVPTIYEYWCFFQVKEIMDSFSPMRKTTKIINENPLTHELSPGLCIEYTCGAELFFNKSYGGSAGYNSLEKTSPCLPNGVSYSHTLRPDIVVAQNGQKLIFDAKYKGKFPGLYCEGDDGTIQRWKDEDLDKMHTYRDAIFGVMGSFILYPGSYDIFYPRHDGSSFIDGVGALSLRPENGSGKRKYSIGNIRRVIEEFLRTA